MTFDDAVVEDHTSGFRGLFLDEVDKRGSFWDRRGICSSGYRQEFAKGLEYIHQLLISDLSKNKKNQYLVVNKFQKMWKKLKFVSAHVFR